MELTETVRSLSFNLLFLTAYNSGGIFQVQIMRTNLSRKSYQTNNYQNAMALTGVRLQFTLGANEMRRDTKFLTIAVHHDINMHIICQNHCGIVFLLVHYDVGGSNAFSSLTYYFVE